MINKDLKRLIIYSYPGSGTNNYMIRETDKTISIYYFPPLWLTCRSPQLKSLHSPRDFQTGSLANIMVTILKQL